MRLLGQAAFVDEDDRAPFGAGLFFKAGQVLRFQVAMAASSRSSARPTGFWQLQPKRSRKTCNAVVAWQAKPNSRRMTLATRSSVQSGVAKPATKSLTNSGSCSGSSLDLRPARPAARRASWPPSRPLAVPAQD